MQIKEDTEIKATGDAQQTNNQQTSAAEKNITSPKHETNVDDREQEGSRRDPSNRWLRTRKSDYDLPDAKRHKGEFKDKRALTSDGKPMFPNEKRKPKKKVACLIGYCGAGYHGMQINPPNKTIEGDLFKAMVEAGAISKNNSNDLKKSGFMRAARTDKGVHAAGNVISLKMIVEDEDVVEKINQALPEQIRVWGYQRVNKSFDCRKMCSSRIYEYLMPTYSFLPPRLNSPLYKLVKRMQADHPENIRVDADGEKFWVDLLGKLEAAGIDQNQLDQITEANREDIPLTVPLQIASETVKKFSGEAREKYRIKKEKLDVFRDTMKLYEGSHNFHNFTNGKDFRDPSAKRYMKNITVSEPFVIGNLEWVSIKIHGQSFMLHQIRKMIGLASLIVRTGCPIDKIRESFRMPKVNIPKAPALGLLLERPVYDGFNEKLKSYGHDPITFDKFTDKMEAFKKKFIYSKIYEQEESEHTFHGFFGFIDYFTGNEASNQGLAIFDFVTQGEINGEIKNDAKETGEKADEKIENTENVENKPGDKTE